MFERDDACALCPLSTGVRSVCIPMRADPKSLERASDRAIVLIGNQPGVEEDREDKHFCGAAGIFLDKCYLGFRDLRSKGHCYVVNAVRCKPPKDAVPSVSQIRHCRTYLERDVETLKSQYATVVLVACGASACRLLIGKALRDAVRQQAREVLGCTTFFTENPAILFSRRNPSKGHSVREHLGLLHEWLDTGTIRTEILVPDAQRAVGPTQSWYSSNF